jgi:hypothetical protein
MRKAPEQSIVRGSNPIYWEVLAGAHHGAYVRPWLDELVFLILLLEFCLSPSGRQGQVFSLWGDSSLVQYLPLGSECAIQLGEDDSNYPVDWRLGLCGGISRTSRSGQDRTNSPFLGREWSDSQVPSKKSDMFASQCPARAVRKMSLLRSCPSDKVASLSIDSQQADK